MVYEVWFQDSNTLKLHVELVKAKSFDEARKKGSAIIGDKPIDCMRKTRKTRGTKRWWKKNMI